MATFFRRKKGGVSCFFGNNRALEERNVANHGERWRQLAGNCRKHMGLR